jgi:hypothetical protein
MRIIGENGKFIRTTSSSGAVPTTGQANSNGNQLTEDLVGLIYSGNTRIRWLKDGRIIFSGFQVTLPAVAQDMPSHPELFAFAPGKQAVVCRLLPRQSVDQIGDGAEYFEMSPDGTHVSIPDSNGKVDVVDLGSGNVLAVQDKPTSKPGKDQGDAIQTIPVWRSDDELTFVAPDGKGRTQVMLWSLSKSAGTVLSGGWGPAATQPANAPKTDKPMAP